MSKYESVSLIDETAITYAKDLLQTAMSASPELTMYIVNGGFDPEEAGQKIALAFLACAKTLYEGEAS